MGYSSIGGEERIRGEGRKGEWKKKELSRGKER